MSNDILFVAPSAYPLGGIATWLDYLVPGLRKRGWNITLGLVEGRFHDVDAYLRVHPEKHVVRISCGTGTRESRLRRLIAAMSAVRPDIVVAVNIADVATAVARLRKDQKCSSRFVTTLHALQPELIRSIGDSAEVLDGLICTNRLACELVVRKALIASDRIYYAPCGVETNDGSVLENEKSDGVLRIAYVGRLERTQKRIQDLTGIVAELDRRGIAYKLLIAGGGPDEQWLRVELSNAASRGRVRFLGTLSGDDLAKQVYSRVDALLITSLWETGPIVAWEAMASGVPVATSTYIGSGLEGSLKSGDNCLMFPIGDMVAATDCLEKLQNSELRRHLVRGGSALINHRYSKTASIDLWDGCLRLVAQRRPLASPTRLPNMRTAPAGRLDKFFGPRWGETVREFLGFNYQHSEPGGEWPHADYPMGVNLDAFWQFAMALDRKV